jgi:hypothetical protein
VGNFRCTALVIPAQIVSLGDITFYKKNVSFTSIQAVTLENVGILM